MSKNLKFKGTITMGLFLPDKPEAWKNHVEKFEGQEVWGSVAKFKPYQQRSNEQNRYYHGVVVKILSEEIGYLPAEMHEVLKYEFLTKEITSGKGHTTKIVGSTATLSTGEMEDFLAKVRTWASVKMSIFIPVPNEVPFDY